MAVMMEEENKNKGVKVNWVLGFWLILLDL
jgi:hypothetical protein